MSDETFEVEFRISLGRTTVWRRLTGKQSGDELWMPGFDSAATITHADPAAELRVVKKDPPCEGTDIVVTLVDDATGTRVRVVQSGFGQLPGSRELFALGWRRIVAGLHTYLATGIHARRFLRAWGDFGADSSSGGGGTRVQDVRSGGLADRLGIHDGDLLVTTVDELFTVLRVLDSTGSAAPAAEWIRDGELHTAARPA
jgi:hypothetical protein